MANSHANDAMIRRLEKELEERNSAVQGLISSAQDKNRDLNTAELETIQGIKERMGEIGTQLAALESASEQATKVRDRMNALDTALSTARRTEGQDVLYRSSGRMGIAGAVLQDQYRAALGDRQAQERLEVFHRVAAHQKTSDNLGVIPDPIVGEVLNFIDASRPIVTALNPRPMTTATWHRPKVTARVNVAVQGAAGAAADEKTELVSQKMTITRITGNAKTFGGYVNVSRQDIDFSTPQIMDIIIQDLAAEYATETEAAAAANLTASANTIEITGAIAGPLTQDNLLEAIWAGAAAVWNATKGQGTVYLAVATDQLRHYGRLFSQIVNPQNQASPGFAAANFGQGIMGFISGIPVLMSAGLPTGQNVGSAFMFSTAALEAYEQRVGTLQAVEPSVLGVQVAYAGYFTPLTVETGGIQKLVNLAA